MTTYINYFPESPDPNQKYTAGCETCYLYGKYPTLQQAEDWKAGHLCR